MRGVMVVSATIAASGLATALAAPAVADDTDDVFISTLESKDIPFASAENAVTLAAAVCDYMAAGQAPGQVAVEIMGPANWTAEQGGVFVRVATRSYCPS